MKTLQELYEEIVASDELKTAFAKASKDGKVPDFLKAQGCEVTEEELCAFLKSRTGELSDEEMDNVAGGGCNTATEFEALYSTITAGLICVAWVLASNDDGYVGQRKDSDGRLCNK